MILISFSYKGAVIKTKLFDYVFNEKNRDKVHEMVNNGKIELPGNWDRYVLSRC